MEHLARLRRAEGLDCWRRSLVSIADNLVIARDSVDSTESDPRTGWAWMKPEYRADAGRAFHGAKGAQTLSDAGVAALELAISAIWRNQRVKAVWQEEDLWTVVLSLLDSAASDHSIDLKVAAAKLLKPKPVRIAAALANVSWSSGPVVLGSIALAAISSEEDADALADLLGLDEGAKEAFRSHATQLLREFGSYVAATVQSPRQLDLAQQDFIRALNDLVGLVLLLSDQLEANGIYSLRGATNRPGIRGIALDRGALGDLLAKKGAGELAARVLSISGWGASNLFRWYSADPLPLDKLLSSDVADLIGELLVADDAIAQRLRVAARWYARSMWADAHEDSALAVSVALDSLLTGKDAVPGAVSKGRFALLERDVSKRAARFARYDDVYQVRSAIAHGGDATRKLAVIGGARSMMDDTKWVAGQLLELRGLAKPVTDADFREAWAGLQWGTLGWTLSSE